VVGNKERPGQRLGLVLALAISLTAYRPPPVEAEEIARPTSLAPRSALIPQPSILSTYRTITILAKKTYFTTPVVWLSLASQLPPPAFLPTAAHLFPERTLSLTSAVRVRQGDTVMKILSFHGVSFDSEQVATLNPYRKNLDQVFTGQSLVLPIPPKTLTHPYKKILFTDSAHQNHITPISPILAGDPAPDYGAGYDPNYPYAFFGHTQENQPGQGPFAHLRQMSPGDKIYLSRTWFGDGNTDWCWGTIEQILHISTEAEQINILNNHVNSGLIAILTCFTETPNPDDRLIVLVKIDSYRSPPPANY